MAEVELDVIGKKATIIPFVKLYKRNGSLLNQNVRLTHDHYKLNHNYP